MSSDTPRTDMADAFSSSYEDIALAWSYARHLERELAAAQEQIAALKAENESMRELLREAEVGMDEDYDEQFGVCKRIRAAMERKA